MKTSFPATCQVDLQPVGRRVEVRAETTVLDAARQAGVELVAICGGEGVCGTCLVRQASGQLSAPTLTEEAELGTAALQQGMRLACQAQVLGDVRIEIPPESLTTAQRLQIEGQETAVQVHPVVIPLDVSLPGPTLEDLRSDLTRLRAALVEQGYPSSGAAPLKFSQPLLVDLSNQLRRWQHADRWRARLALRGDEVVAALPPGAPLFGLAVDVGTTKVAAYLVELENGGTVAKQGAMNPQIAYGEDVISRIHYANEHTEGAATLQRRLVETLNNLLAELCAKVQADPEQVVEAVVVGNTAMHHIFARLPLRQLGLAPYVASVSDALEIPAAQLGLQLANGAYVYLPPNIAGYVGADHVAMLLGAGLVNETAHPLDETVLALDIGTNTEISLFHQGRHWSCSCASGPAFEGAHIADGMRAAPGAIERVHIHGEAVWLHTIHEQPAVGICGSGILDAVAELLKNGLLGPRGNFTNTHSRLDMMNGRGAFVLAPGPESGTGQPVVVRREDINEIQLAKGAIRAGIDVLLQHAGIPAEAIERFLVAGAFGTYLDVESAIAIGMFPDLPRERFSQIGNAAGAGARQLLVSRRLRQAVTAVADEVEYIELAKSPYFMKTYMNALALVSR